MSINHNPLHKSPERAFTLQKYLLLHTQHDALQSHLAAISHASPTSATSNSPTVSRPSTHSTLAEPISFARSTTRPALHKRRSSLPPSFPCTSPSCESGPRHATTSTCSGSEEVLEEEKKLIQVNQQIKSTLTELLNCQSVRQDRLYRVWVQSRLMDAEMELKEGRRRSVAAHRDGVRRGSWDVNSYPTHV